MRFGLLLALFAMLTVTVAPTSIEAAKNKDGHGEHGISAVSPQPPTVPKRNHPTQPLKHKPPSKKKGQPAQTQNSIVSPFSAQAASVSPFVAQANSLGVAAAAAALPNYTNNPRDMKILVITTDVNDYDYQGISAFLNQLGTPFATLEATKTTLTSSMLWDGVSKGYYQGIILTDGQLLYDSGGGNWVTAFTTAEWQTLWDYETMFGVRQVTSYTLPSCYLDSSTNQQVCSPESYGLLNPTYAYQDTSVTALQAKLTTAGASIFPYLNAANPITIKSAWTYLNTINPAEAANVTSLLKSADGKYDLAVIKTYANGRQNLALSAENNSFLTHSQLLSYGVINWVTKGIFLGERHVAMDVQPDDLFIDDDMWNTTTMTDTSGLTFRMGSTDLNAFVNWQKSARTKYNGVASNLKIEWPFNAEGTTGIYNPDTLTSALLTNKNEFNFISHTYTHQNLDAVNAATTNTELTNNNNYAVSKTFNSGTTTGSKYFKDAMIQPDISGLYNATFQQAAYNWGIRYLISDRSRPEWNAPSPNAGFYSNGLLIIPRFASNLFYNLRTPTQWVSEYNCYYGPKSDPKNICADLPNSTRFTANRTYQQILDDESTLWASYMFKWDLSPIMFHQPNAGTYDGTHSLLGDLIDATLAKYSAAYNLPILNLTQHEVGIRIANRMAYNASGVTATYNPGAKTITLKTVKAATIPVTGVTYGTAETYGGQKISQVTMTANQTLTISTP
jgi:hypothetical protein